MSEGELHLLVVLEGGPGDGQELVVPVSVRFLLGVHLCEVHGYKFADRTAGVGGRWVFAHVRCVGSFGSREAAIAFVGRKPGGVELRGNGGEG